MGTETWQCNSCLLANSLDCNFIAIAKSSIAICLKGANPNNFVSRREHTKQGAAQSHIHYHKGHLVLYFMTQKQTRNLNQATKAISKTDKQCS